MQITFYFFGFMFLYSDLLSRKNLNTKKCLQTFMQVCVLGLFATPWTIACQVPLSMGFSRQEYWSGLPCPPPEELPDPGIKPVSYVSCIARGVFTNSATWEALRYTYTHTHIYMYTHTHTYSFSDSFPLQVITRY